MRCFSALPSLLLLKFDLLVMSQLMHAAIFPFFFFVDMSSTAFIEALPVTEFVCQLLNRDIRSRPLSDADRVKV